MRLPAPMLAEPGVLPVRDGYAYEVKWDGFRALVSTVDGLLVRSRRGWDMTAHLPELEQLPPGLVLDGELVAWGEDGLPSFPLLCRRILNRKQSVPVTYLVFDVLAADGMDTTERPYSERRELLEELRLSGPAWHTPPSFAAGQALYEATLRAGLEGIVAKRLSDPYRPGERGWIKAKHRSYWRFESELERIRRSSDPGRRRVRFV